MGFHKKLVRVLLVSVLAAGCPLEDDTKVDGDTANTEPGDQNAGSNGDDEPTDDDDGTDEGGSNGTPDVDPSEDAGVPEMEMDAALPALDAGPDPEPVMDAGPMVEEDAGPMVEEDAGPMVEEDAGPTVVVPDLGAAELAPADRAKLISDLLVAENYMDTWFPYFQSNGDRRPLVASGGHSNQVRVRQNAVAKQATDAWIAAGKTGPLVMPNGSIIAKESYKLEVDMVTYTLVDTKVMAKVAVLDPATFEGKWFYMTIKTGTPPANSMTCVNCHNGRTARSLWPKNDLAVPPDPGGKLDALVPYDYLFVPFCADPANVLLCQPPA